MNNKLKINVKKLTFNEKCIINLYLPLIKFKGIKVLNKKDRLVKLINMNNLNDMYENYISKTKIRDNLLNINTSELIQYKNNLNNKDNYLNVFKNRELIMKLYEKKDNESSKYNKLIDCLGKNILKENYKNVITKKMSFKINEPYFFFTAKYNEKSMPSQIRSWYNSVYNFLKFERSEVKYLDMYSSKLIKLFFSLKYIQRKKIWDIILLNGIKLKPNSSIIKDMNVMIKYTSKRSSWSLKALSSYPKVILTFSWLLEQIKFSSFIGKVISDRKEGIIAGFKTKKKNYIHKLDKVFISKPIFKHTTYNVIIDLFVYNNKTNKLQKFENMLLRRILYKYMYSMYINYKKKYKETINRPRFFYLNLIEPKIFNYYSNVIKLYEKIIIASSKENFYNLIFLFLKLNYISKNYIVYIKNKYILIYNNILNNNNNNKLNNKNVDFKEKIYLVENKDVKKKKINSRLNLAISWNRDNVKLKRQFFIKKTNLFINNNNIDINNNNYIIYNDNVGIIKKIIKYKNMFKMNNELFDYNKEDLKKNKKKINNKLDVKSKIDKSKEYLRKLEWKSNTPVDLNKLTLWSRKGLNNNNNNIENSREKKLYSFNKYSLEQFKKKIFYAKGKAKRKVSPKIWKQKLMSFFLLSRSQKRNTNLNNKFSDFNKKIYLKNNDIKNNELKLNDKNLHKNKKVKLFNIENKKIIKSESNKDSIIFNKNKWFDDNYSLDYGNNHIINATFNYFFIINKDKKLYEKIIKNKDKVIYKLRNKFELKKYKYDSISNTETKINIRKDNLSMLGIKDSNNIYNNIKILWNSLDFSIIKSLNKILESDIVYDNNYRYNNQLNRESEIFKVLLKVFNKFSNYSNLWYIHLIKKEFYVINKDILLSKTESMSSNIDISILCQYKYDKNMYDNIKLYYQNNKGKLDINIWSSNTDNKRGNLKNNNIIFNLDIFKPYYRYMIPLFVYESYKVFISHLKNMNFFVNIKIVKGIKNSWINTNSLIIFNFIIVKTLLDLLRYNYRSLIRVKPKYYYLNKLRYYETKAKKLNFNTWISSIKYIKRLRKTPRLFWLRYHKLISFFFNRIIQNAELDTKRKVLLPFVFYFEDLIFNIYGKWGIIRLWPLKRFYLNSFILAERIMLIILAQSSSNNSISEYRQSVRNLINILRWSQVKRTYDYYNENKYRWPIKLINIMKDSKKSHSLYYNTLEYFDRNIEKTNVLSVYSVKNERLNNYLPFIKSHYIHAFKENLNNINNNSIKRKLLYKYGKINNIQYIYYWLKPLNSYIMYLKNQLDISGVKFKLTGRPGVIRSNVRSFTKTYFYGNLLGPRHFNNRTLKTTSLTNPMLRGTIKSNIDYDYYTSKSNNGSITLKIWISSIFSSDIHELILYLLKIKYLYLELVNRYYLVYYKFYNLKDIYLLNEVSKSTSLKKKKNIKKVFKNLNNNRFKTKYVKSI